MSYLLTDLVEKEIADEISKALREEARVSGTIIGCIAEDHEGFTIEFWEAETKDGEEIESESLGILLSEEFFDELIAIVEKDEAMADQEIAISF